MSVFGGRSTISPAGRPSLFSTSFGTGSMAACVRAGERPIAINTMRKAVNIWTVTATCGVSLLLLLSPEPGQTAAADHKIKKELFQTSDRCFACHNGLSTSGGEDISIGFSWRPTMMANSARDPYWQAGVRRESIDHAESKAAIEDECSKCHMPMARYQSKSEGKEGEVFSHLSFGSDNRIDQMAQDGVSCSLCHQITKDKL